MEGRTSKNDNSDGSRKRPRQYQRRPRIAFLLVLVSILIVLVLLAIPFTSVTNASIDGSASYTYTSFEHEQIPREKSEDFYHRKSSVWNNEDIEEEEGTVDFHHNEWSQEQIKEIEIYYIRYLEVFHEMHGYEYEPEDKQVVYTEYLAFRERKAKARAERKRTDQAQNIETKSSTENDLTKQAPEDHDNASFTGESHIDNASSAPDSVIIKHDPYYLEMDWTEFNEAGGDLYSPSSNSTNYMATSSTPSKATAVVVERTYVDDTTTIQHPLSGGGKTLNL